MRKETKAQRMSRFYDRMRALGFTWNEANALRRIERTLQRWAEQECGNSIDHCSWSIERDEEMEKPYRVTHYHHGMRASRITYLAIPDREKGALKRMLLIVADRNARHTDGAILSYHQCDPRGCMLYLVKENDLPNGDHTQLESHYTRGFAVCI